MAERPLILVNRIVLPWASTPVEHGKSRNSPRWKACSYVAEILIEADGRHERIVGILKARQLPAGNVLIELSIELKHSFHGSHF